MVIDAKLIRIKLEYVEKIIQNPDDYVFGIVGFEKIGQGSLWTGSYWQLIHYVLTKEVAWPGCSCLPPPLCNLILGGRLLHSEEDTMRYLTPNEVKEVANFLEEHPLSWVEKEFYKVKDQPVNIYHMLMEEDELPGLLDIYNDICSLYFKAAKAGDAMLIDIS